MMVFSKSRSFAAALSLALLACGSDDPRTEDLAVTPPPQRTATQDRALRAMAMDIAEGQGCQSVLDRYLPLPEDRPEGVVHGELPILTGRLWVSECNIERHGEQLAVHVGGRGWQWIERSSAGPLGSSFSVRGHVRFESTIDLDANVDLSYDAADHRAVVAMTPRGAPRTRLTALGALPVSADGGWSGIIGGLGGLLGSNVEASARPMVEEQGAEMVRRYLATGATFTFDLCTGQLDGALGPLADGEAPPARPYEEGNERWIDNLRGRIRRGGLDLSGPWATQGKRLVVDVGVEEGGPLEVALICQAEAALVASAYIDGAAPSISQAMVRRNVALGRPIALSVDTGDCASAVIAITTSSDAPVRYRYRVRREGETHESIARCGE
jgi:hypothetical protein